MSDVKTVAVIGSRDITAEERSMILKTAGWLARRGVRGRSGGAKGSDDAWEEGWAILAPELFTVCAPDERARRAGVDVVRPPYPEWVAERAVAEWEFGAELPKLGLPPYEDADVRAAFEARSSWTWMEENRPFIGPLMIRNAAIVCPTETEAVDMVLGLLSPRKGGGGTGHAFRLAQAMGVPTFDLRNPMEQAAARDALEELVRPRGRSR